MPSALNLFTETQCTDELTAQGLRSARRMNIQGAVNLREPRKTAERRETLILQLKIRELRKAAGLTQKELADRLHYTPAAVNQWERGINNPATEALPGIARALGCPIGALFGEEQN